MCIRYVNLPKLPLDGLWLNGNPWGGSFILEASVDGNSWTAKSSNGTFLSREGLETGGENNETS